MKRRIALAFGLLSALSWVGAAAADEPIKTAPAPAGPAAPGPVVIKADGYGHGPMMCPDTCCEPACGGGGANAGIGFYYIQPHWESNPAIFSENFVEPFTRGRQDDFDYDFDFAPRVWLGFTDCNGAGARLRFWSFDDSASLARIDNDNAGDGIVFLSSAAPLGLNVFTNGTVADPQTLSTNSDLKLEVWDAEGTYSHQVCGFEMTYFGGLRYVHFSESYNAAVVDNNTAALLAVLSSGHNLNVWGITGGVETRRCLGGMGLTLYGSSRASLLYGHGQQTAAMVAAEGFDQNGGFGEGGDASRDDLLPILEAELGAEFNRDMGGMNAFLQVALVGQVWFGAGNSSRSSNPDVLGINAGGTVDDSNLGFFGVTVSGGIRY